MTKIHHPHNKFERKQIAEKKHKFVNEKKGKIASERPAKVWRKLAIEQAKVQELEHERDEDFRNNHI